MFWRTVRTGRLPFFSFWYFVLVGRFFKSHCRLHVGLAEPGIVGAEGNGAAVQEKSLHFEFPAAGDWKPEIGGQALVGDFGAEMAEVGAQQNCHRLRYLALPMAADLHGLKFTAFDQGFALLAIFVIPIVLAALISHPVNVIFFVLLLAQQLN